MGFLHPKQPQKQYISNTTPEQLDLLEHLDQQVVLAVREDTPIVDGAVHACLTQAGYDKALAALQTEQPGRYGGYQTVLGLALDTVLQQEAGRALVVYGLAGNQIDFTLAKADLKPLEDVIDSFCILYAAARNAMPAEKAQTLMRPKTVWLLGELPKTGQEGECFGFVTIKREGYESVKVFLTPDSARKYNEANRPVTPVRLAVLERFVAGKFAVIVEPHRNYWLELGAEHVQNRK